MAIDELDDQELLATLAPLSVRSTLDPPEVAHRDRPGLGSADEVAALVDQFERGLFDNPFASHVSVAAERMREVAGSIAFQAIVGQVANPVLLAHLVLGVGLEATFDQVRWRVDGWAVRYGLTELRRVEPWTLAEVAAQLHADLVDPWAAALTEVVPVPERVLVGNAAAAIWTGVVAVHRLQPLAPAELAEAAHLVLGPLSADADGGFTRDTCCLIHHAGLAPCDECPLSAETPATPAT